jgi:hypothetical protein
MVVDAGDEDGKEGKKAKKKRKKRREEEKTKERKAKSSSSKKKRRRGGDEGGLEDEGLGLRQRMRSLLGLNKKKPPYDETSVVLLQKLWRGRVARMQLSVHSTLLLRSLTLARRRTNICVCVCVCVCVCDGACACGQQRSESA